MPGSTRSWREAAALASLEQQQALGGFEPGELDRLLAEGDADIEGGDVLDGEEALAERRGGRDFKKLFG